MVLYYMRCTRLCSLPQKITRNRSGLLLEEESEEKYSNDVDGGNEMDNLGGKLSRLSSLTLSSLNSTFHLNKRRAEYSTKKKYHSVDSESPTHHYDNVPLPLQFSEIENRNKYNLRQKPLQMIFANYV